MEKVDIYGVGNALVDFDFEVSEDTLVRLGIEKGVMTLIEGDTEQRLMEDMAGIKHEKACGGSAANAIITAANLGANCFYSCKVAYDLAGDFFFEDLTKEGVNSNITHTNRDLGVTGKCIAMITPDAERTMNTYLGITAELSSNELVKEAIEAAKYTYIEGYLVASDSAFEAALLCQEIAKKANVKIATGLADINMIRFFKDRLQCLIDNGLDILFANEQEAKLFTEEQSVSLAADKLSMCAKQVIITRGDEGALIVQGDERLIIKPYKVKAIDTIGAGDVFAGSFLYALTQNYSAQVAGNIACYAASEVVTKFGPRLSDEQIAKVKRHIETFKLNAVAAKA